MLNTVHFDPWQRSLFVQSVSSANTKEKGPLLAGKSTHCIKSLFPYKDRLTRAQMCRFVYKTSCWDCQEFYVGKTKRTLHDRKTEHFKFITSSNHSSAIADHVASTGHNMKWGHFEILARGRSDTYCKIKETLLIRNLQPSLNENVSSGKLYLS